MVANATVECGQARNPAQSHGTTFQIDSHAVVRKLTIHDVGYTGLYALTRLKTEYASAVVFEIEPNIRSCHRKATHDVKACGVFAALASQELTPSGDPRE